MMEKTTITLSLDEGRGSEFRWYREVPKVPDEDAYKLLTENTVDWLKDAMTAHLRRESERKWEETRHD